MSLKDWKKQRMKEEFDHISYEWKNKKNNESIIIFNWRRFKGPKNYEVLITDWPTEIAWKNQLTKSQALKFAKNYMRKH